MKKFGFLLLFLIGICSMTGCGTKDLEKQEVQKDERGLYLIHSTFSVYSDEKDPMFMEYGEKTSIKSFLPQSNCLPDCIHHKEKPLETLSDGTQIYDYEVDGVTYYYIQCNKNNSKYHGGKDILIGRNKEKLLSLC